MFKSFDDVVTFQKANIDAMVQSGTKVATGVEEITKEVFGYTTKTLESTMDVAKSFGGCKTAAEVMQLQQKVAKDNWDAFMAEGTRLSEMGTVVAKSAFEPIQARYKAAFDSVAAK